jgi:hypothetical protein
LSRRSAAQPEGNGERISPTLLPLLAAVQFAWLRQVLRVSNAKGNRANRAGEIQKSFGSFSVKRGLGFAVRKPQTAASSHGKNLRDLPD